ncbi:MAG: chromate transporter [Collimonas sp.]
MTTESIATVENSASEAPSTRELFFGFLTLGMIGFGGVLPLARRLIVEQRRWLTSAQFTDMLGLCQCLPGGNIINLSVATGLHFRGVAGALASLLGLIAAPSAVVIALGVIYQRFQDNLPVQHMFAGLAAAASGLLIAMALKMLVPILKKPVPLLIACLFFVSIGLLRLPLLPTMLILAPLSILAIWKLPS